MTSHTSATSPIAAATPATSPAPTRRVVDAPTRMFHWLFALTFAGAYLTAESEHWRLLHATLGYTFAGLLGFRLLYGTVGPRHARLGLLWRRVAGTGAWLRALVSARSPGAVNWRQGSALATGLAILTMLLLVLPLALSGYATYNDWGNALGGDWLEEVHEFFGNALLMMVALHLGLLATLSLLRRQNLARSMLTGRVPGRGPDLVAKNRAWLAALLLAAAVAFGIWHFWQSRQLPQFPPIPQWVDAPNGTTETTIRHR